MSGILFNFAFDPVIRAIHKLKGVTILVFADDVLIIAHSPEALQQALDIFTVQCAKLGLHINTKKSFSFHLTRTCLPTEFIINNEILTPILDHEHIKFLGKPIGFQIINDHSQIKEYHEKAEIIISSALTPWQKIDALKSFFYPTLMYAERTQQIPKTDWSDLDIAIRALVKKHILFLSPRAANEYLYGSTNDNLFVIPLAAEDSDIAHIDGAFKLLTSNDELCINCGLERVVCKCVLPPQNWAP